MRTLRIMSLAVLLMLGSVSLGDVVTQSGVISTSGNSVTLDNPNGGMTITFEEIFAGSPATVSVVIQGCMNAGTCDSLDTYATPTNANRAPTLSKVYARFIVTATWTGGSSPTVTINMRSTTARNGGGGGGSGPSTADTFVTMTSNADLSAQRVLTAGSGITVTDGGANSTVTIAATGGVSFPLTSPTANPATSGQLRLANNGDQICWRNAANSGNECIYVDGGDLFEIGATAGVVLGAPGSNAGMMALPQGTGNALPSNSWALEANGSIGTSFGWVGPTAENGSAGLVHVAAASSHKSALTVSAVSLPDHATQAADTVVMNATGGSASPTAVAMPTSGTNGCAGASNALTYNTSTHALGCNTISGGSANTFFELPDVNSGGFGLDSTNKVEIIAVYIPTAVTFSHMVTQVGTQDANASNHYDWGISDTSGGATSNLIFHVGSQVLTATSGTVQTYGPSGSGATCTAAPCTIQAGWYYIVECGQNTTGNIATGNLTQWVTTTPSGSRLTTTSCTSGVIPSTITIPSINQIVGGTYSTGRTAWFALY